MVETHPALLTETKIQWFLGNVQQLANLIVGKLKDLQFAIPVVKIRRKDSIELRQRILRMSPAEKKEAGHQQVNAMVPKEKPCCGKESEGLQESHFKISLDSKTNIYSKIINFR
jgi:hypothetical protein